MNLKNTKILGAILGVLLFIVLIAGITYAAFTWRSNNINISGTTQCFTVNYTTGQTLTNESVLLYDISQIVSGSTFKIKENMSMLDIKASIDESCEIPASLTIKVNVTSLDAAFIDGDSVGAFRCALVSYDPTTYPELSDLYDNSLTLIQNKTINDVGEISFNAQTLTGTSTGYLVIFYINGELAGNDAGNGLTGTTFGATVTGIVQQTE